MENDLIIGLHSISEAIKNTDRKIVKLSGTAKGIQELEKNLGQSNKLLKDVAVEKIDSHKLQGIAKDFCKQKGWEYRRITSQVLLQTQCLEERNFSWFLSQVEKKDCPEKFKKILILDQVTDIHNLAAISRTAAFFGVGAILYSMGSGISKTPAFFRMASGACEHVEFINCNALHKIALKLQSLEDKFTCIGLSEKNSKDVNEQVAALKGRPLCLVMGAEDKGISNALQRNLDFLVALEASGPIDTLNVSVASALAMKEFF
jgi:23S rRNA (guanosine2251-2'-O)-methyltransferase